MGNTVHGIVVNDTVTEVESGPRGIVGDVPLGRSRVVE